MKSGQESSRLTASVRDASRFSSAEYSCLWYEKWKYKMSKSIFVAASCKRLIVAASYFCELFLPLFFIFSPFLAFTMSTCAPHPAAVCRSQDPWCCCWGPTLTNSCNESGTSGRETQTFPQDSSIINEPGLGQIAEQDDAGSRSWGQTWLAWQ